MKPYVNGTIVGAISAIILSVALTVWAAHKASAQIMGVFTNWPTNILHIENSPVTNLIISTNWVFKPRIDPLGVIISDKTNVTWISGLNPAYDYELGFREDGIVVWRKRP